MKRIDNAKRAATPALVAILLSTTALAAVPDDAGVLLSVTPRGVAPPVVERLAGDTLAGRSFTAADGRVLELLLSDGTTLRLAPGSRVTIEDYSFDDATRAGALAVRVEAGTVRITGGRLNTTSPVRVLTPAGVGELRDGAGVIEVDAEGMTTTHLLFGDSFTFAANGTTAEIYRPGFEVRTEPEEEDLDRPRRDEAGGAEQVAFALNPALAPAPEGEVAEVEPGAGPTGLTPTQTFPTLVALEETRAEAEQEGATANAVLAARESFESDLDSGAGPATAGAGRIGGNLGAGGGFGPGITLGAVSLGAEAPSQSLQNVRSLSQNRDPQERVQQGAESGLDKLRPLGLTTNRMFSASETITSVLPKEAPGAVGFVAIPDDPPKTKSVVTDNAPLQYFFIGSDGGTLVIGEPGEEKNVAFFPLFLEGGDDTIDLFRTALIAPAELPNEGEMSDFQEARVVVGQEGSIFGDDESRTPGLFRILQSGFSVLTDERQLEGTIWEGYGLSSEDGQLTQDAVISREEDNFLLVELRPAQLALIPLRERFDVLTIQASVEKAREFLNTLGVITFDSISDDPAIDPPSDETTIKLAAALGGIILGGEGVDAVIEELSEQRNALAELAEPEFVLPQDFRDTISIGVDESRPEVFIFAAGDVADPEGDEIEGSLAGERRVERFFLSPGLEGYEEKDAKRVASLVRAFLRNATAFREQDGSGGLKLADTGLIVVGTPANSVQNSLGHDGNEQTAAIHVDFGIEGLGEQSKLNQRSTLSATIGEVAYGVDEGIGVDGTVPILADKDADNEVVLRGRTIGSTRGPTEDDPEGERGSVLAVGEVFNTAAGGGGEVDGEPLPGRATYLVIENFDPVGFDPEDPETTGGRELPVGAAADPEQFAILRLATATQSVKLDAADQVSSLEGFAAALGEVVSGNRLDLVPLVSGADENGLVLEFGPTDNRVEARLRLINPDTDETRELTLGGLTGTETKGASAFVDPARFAARTEGQDAEVAMVSGELVKDGLANLGEGEGADTKAFLGRLSEVDVPDLKWGFFFGDVDSGDSGAGARTHVHLGSWVAGRIADPSRLPRSGTATYGGHAVGNVTNSGNAYTQIGSYQSTWNFGSRAGLTDLNFDGARMRGFAQAAEGSVRFGGGLSGDGRNASIAGAFVRGNETGIAAPGGQIGAFRVSGDNYGAAGTFAAKKR